MLNSKIFKFLILGGVSTLVDLLIYFVLIYFDILYWLAICISYSISMIGNFYFGRKYVFLDGTKLEKPIKEFIVVIIIAISGMLFNILLVYLFGRFGIDYYSGRVVAIIIVFFYNYIARRIFVYH